MENLLLLLAGTYALSRRSTLRNTPDVFIGTTGCSVGLPAPVLHFDSRTTDAGDTLYFTEQTRGQVAYGVICISLSEAEGSVDEAAELLYFYLSKLHRSFGIHFTTGPEAGSILEQATGIRSLTDYWRDLYDKDWKVKGYTNGSVLSVLYVRNISEGHSPYQDRFLDSFSFRAA